MYLAMDEIGIENTREIKTIASESGRWKFIYTAAESFGFEGVHFTPSLYKTFNLDLKDIPDYFERFKLTFHFGGIYKLTEDSDLRKLNDDFSECFEIAVKHRMHDISIHPPFINKLAPEEKRLSLDYFSAFICNRLKEALSAGISLSLESHISGKFFQFNGLGEYVKFLDAYPDLGALIDFSHNYYDGYSEEEIIKTLSRKNIKGFHISDAFHGASFGEDELREKTHLPVGDGEVDYSKLLNAFPDSPDKFGVLEIKSDNEGIARSINNIKGIGAK